VKKQLSSRGCALFVAAIGLFMLSSSCKVDETSFNAKLFVCNPSAVDPACSTDSNGAPMACVPAYQLGGQNFCAASCDRKAGSDGAETVCMATGAETDIVAPGAVLSKCDPTAGEDVCGNQGLSCLRTDLRSSDGVCLTVSPCQSTADCHDPTRATCMGDLLTTTYGAKAQFQTDHTYCLQSGCNASGSACSPGESCLRKMLSRAALPPDICVPNCDANQNCPPNYFCIPALYSKVSPPICIPGLPGFRCKTKLDCLVGDCVPSGSGFNYCSTSCGSDDDCAEIDSEQETFICNKDKGQCIGSRVFIGGTCKVDTDCRGAEICGFTSAGAKDGNCFLPCKAPDPGATSPASPYGSCDTISSVPQMCIPQARTAPPVCVPTAFGNPCFLGNVAAGIPASADANCMGGLTCRPVSATTGICSTICLTDDDCLKNRFSATGYCQIPGNFCRTPIKDGDACDPLATSPGGLPHNQQCVSKSCIAKPAATAGERICDKTPGW
jgi:hypothetical protein